VGVDYLTSVRASCVRRLPMTLARAPSAITDHRLRDAMIEPIDKNDPIESAENAEPIEPTERTEPTLPIDRMEPFEPIDSSESSDQSDH